MFVARRIACKRARPCYGHSFRPSVTLTNGVKWCVNAQSHSKGKGSPYSITERRVPELISVLGSQPAGDMSHKPGGRLPLLSARPAVTLTTLKRAATVAALL